MREKNGKKPTTKEVSDGYDGCNAWADRKIQQLESTSYRLIDFFIQIIGKIINEEHPDKVSIPLEESHSSPDQHIMETSEFSWYRRFSTLH